MVVTISQAYAGMINSFRNECKDLITKFKEKHSESFSVFAEMFRLNKFSLIYEKYVGSFFYYDFKEDTLQIAKYLMLNEHFLGGLYLLYGLFYIQEEPKLCVRLEYNEFEKIQQLIKEERQTLLATCQPGYVFAKLLKNEAFMFPYFAREFSMEGHQRARLVYSKQTFVSEGKPTDKKEWLDKFLRDLDVADDLRRVDEEYFKKKRKLKEEYSELNLALDMLPDDTLGGLITHVMEVDKPESIPDVDIGAKRRKIKNRTMKKKQRGRPAKSEKVGRPVKSENVGRPVKSEKVDVNPPVKRKRGCPRGKRKLYFKDMVNGPEFGSEEFVDSDPDKPTLDLPQID